MAVVTGSIMAGAGLASTLLGSSEISKAKSLDSRLSIKDNMNQELKPITIADKPITFRTNIRGVPRGVTAVKSEQACLGGFVNWEYREWTNKSRQYNGY